MNEEEIEEDVIEGACGIYMWQKRNAYKLLVGKPGGRRPLGRPMHRWEDNIQVELQEIEWESVDWIYLRHMVGSCERGNESLGSIKCVGSFNYLRNS